MATAEAPAAEEVVEGEPKKKKPILLIALIAINPLFLRLFRAQERGSRA